MIDHLIDNLAYHAMVDDQIVSFNIQRKNYQADMSRAIVCFPSKSQAGLQIVPGVGEHESRLKKELYQKQNRNNVQAHAVAYQNRLHSFLWRFQALGKAANVRDLQPIDQASAHQIRKRYRSYQASLGHNLSPGQVYLLPDAQVDYNRPDRFRHAYCRPVLVAAVRPDQILFMPFSTKVNRMNPVIDILFDNQGDENLAIDARPAVDNLPYQSLHRRASLSVGAAQQVGKAAFLAAVLIPLYAIRKATLALVRERLKKC